MRNPGIFRIVTGCALISLAACSKKDDTATEAASAPAAAEKPGNTGGEKIPGEKDFHAAVAEKNYSAAVERLMGMQPLLASPEQRDHWSGLYGELRSTLMDSSDKDPKAAEALMQLRAVLNGR